LPTNLDNFLALAQKRRTVQIRWAVLVPVVCVISA